MQNPGWWLVAVGLIVAAVGLVWLLVPYVPWLGRLPGDLRFEGQQVKFFFPLTTCILLSVILSALVWAFRTFTGR